MKVLAVARGSRRFREQVSRSISPSSLPPGVFPNTPSRPPKVPRGVPPLQGRITPAHIDPDTGEILPPWKRAVSGLGTVAHPVSHHPRTYDGRPDYFYAVFHTSKAKLLPPPATYYRPPPVRQNSRVPVPAKVKFPQGAFEDRLIHCVKRKVRRRVLFALGWHGRNGSGRGYRRNAFSLWGC